MGLNRGARFLARLFSRMTQVEWWMRWATRAVFVGVAVYLSLSHIYEVLSVGARRDSRSRTCNGGRQ